MVLAIVIISGSVPVESMTLSGVADSLIGIGVGGIALYFANQDTDKETGD
jgi:hypothetical protein